MSTNIQWISMWILVIDYKCLVTLIYGTYNYSYPLVIWHSHGKWPIEIDGLPINNVDFSMAMLNNQKCKCLQCGASR